MLTFRGLRAGALLLTGLGLIATAPLAHSQPAAPGATIVADLTLTRDGVLRVEETITVPDGGDFTMSLPLRLQLKDDVVRTFEVSDITTTGAGTTKIANGQFTIDADPGESKFSYTIHNMVTDEPGTQELRWLGVVNNDIASISVAMISPSFEIGIVDCKLGPPGGTRPCADVKVEFDGTLYLEQTDLRKGDAIDLTVQLPPGTVATAAGDTNPFAVTKPVLLALGVLLLALAGLAAFAARARRENAAATAGSDAIDPLGRHGDQVQFTSPGGLLPGEAGLVVDEHADPIDIAATVVDLAVRRYIWITPIGADSNDWQISRVNTPDDQLRDYEKAVYTALLPEGTESVQVSELRAPGRVPAAAIRKAIIADAVDRDAIVDRTSPGPATWLGGALILAGAVVTLALALTAGHALVGVAILLAGVAVVLLPRYLPARTALGRELAGQVRALQRGLDAIRAEHIPPADQETVFSRALPFAVVAGRADSWVRTFRDLNPAADSQPGIYWFGGFDHDRDLLRFAGHFPYFITAMEALFGKQGS
ncbi:DUF2207 family protein [Nocardia sp. XZ_19_385]|uniref:DUF2207 family protein n=1 Tax=Nocardia sp. XZ_19_385 TaxID=2769488 RepID=UPI00188E5937|nr:DUF2207 domain-containing protein [Nocardia sp. XZ_19_385]